MHKTAADLFRSLLETATDATTIPAFKQWCKVTSNHAEKIIIESLTPNHLYRNEDRLMIRLDDRLCHIVINKIHSIPSVGCWHPLTNSYEDEPPADTVRITLPFSPRWVFGQVKNRDIRRIEDYHFFYQLIGRLTKNKVA